MKVALVYFGRKGGGTVYSFEIAKRMGSQVNLTCFVSKQMENISAWEESGLKLCSFKTYSDKWGFLISFFNLKKFIEIKKQITDFNPDVIYFPFFHLWLPIISLMFKSLPQVYTCHDVLLHSGENSSILKWWQNILIKNSKRIIILSSVFKKNITLNKLGEDKIDVIPHGIFDYYKNLDKKEKDEVKKETKTLLFFGRIVDYKGLDVLLKIFPKIKKNVPEARLLIVGSGDINKYKKSLNQSGVTVENKWISDADVKKYFIQSDIVVCPYKDASQSGLIPLAYSFKIPIVATKVGGLVEQVEDGKTGILVNNGDEDSFVDACVLLLNSPLKRMAMGEAGFVKASVEFGWQKISQMVVESLTKAVN